MDATELLTALESNAADTAGLEQALLQALAGGVSDLDAFLAQVVPLLGKSEAAESVLKALDVVFRKNRETDVGRVIGWHAGVLCWRALGDLVRAEVYMRALGDGGDHAAEWQDFYCRFYASRGNWLRLEQFMTETAQRTGMAAVEMKRALARTAHDVGNSAKEMSYWQAVAQAAPSDAEANHELERLYSQLERWSSLADLLKERLKSAEDVAAKVAILERMLAIFSDKMKAESKVLQTYQSILEVDPANLGAIDALLSRYEAAARWTDYAKVLQRKVDRIQAMLDSGEGDRDEVTGRLIALREKQAELNETRTPNAMEAQKAYERILELAPDRGDVLDKLKNLYETRRDFDSLIRIRRTEADRIDDPRARAAVLVELAVMATERLRKIPVAIELWEMVIGLDDRNQDALRNLEALYEREKNVERLCDVLRRRIDLAEEAGRPAEQVQLLEKLAGIYGAKLSDSTAALDAWKRILAVQPTHDRAKRELRQRFLAEHRWDDLDWFLRRFGTPDELARTLESQLGSVTDAGEKRGLLYKLAAMWRDELNTPRNAVKDLEAVLALVPDDQRAATELIALYRSMGDWRRLPHVYEIVIAKVEDRAERRRLMIEAADVQERQLSNNEAAFFLYIAAFKEDMLDDTLREEAERLGGLSRNWDTYVAVLEQAAALMPDDARRVKTWLRVGQIHYGQLHEAAPALEAFRQVLAIEGENREAITALETIYREQSDFASLTGILRRRLDLERRKEEKQAIRFDLANILYKALHRVDDAFLTYVDILADDPDETRAYDELADLLLAERRFEDLLKILASQVDVYSARAGVPDSVMADLHCRIGLLGCALHGASTDVVDQYRKALGFVPLHAHTLELLAGMLGVVEVRLEVVALLAGPYETLKRFAELADLVEIELLDRGDGKDTVSLLWRLHSLYGDKAKDDHKLFRTLARILAVTPADEFCWDQIERVAAGLGVWRDLAARFEEAADALADEEQVKLRLRLARIYWDQLKNPDMAKRAYRAVLDLDASNKDGLDALEGIYEGELDHPQRLWVYQRQYDVSPYTGEKISYAFKIAGVLSDNLGDLPGAVEAVKRILDMDPEYEAAWRLLDSLYSKAERWDDLAGVLTERVRLAERERETVGGDRAAEILREVAGLLLRLAEVREFRLEDLAGAVEVFKSILDRDPTDEQAVHQLERLFRDAAVRVMVAPILLAPYKVRRDRDRLVEVYDVLAEAADSLDDRLGHYDTIARLYEDQPPELDLAFRYRARAFRAAPDRAELVDNLLLVGELMGSTRDAILVLCEKVFDIEDPYRRRETHRTIARVSRDARIERDLAKRHYGAVLESDADDSDAIDALIALHGEDDEVAPLVALVLRKADLVQAPAERAALLLNAGDLYAHRLARSDEAVSSYRGVLDIEPGNVRALEALEVLYGRAEKWDELIDVLGQKADHAATDAAKIAALKKKGLTQHEQKGDTTEAIATFNHVLDIDPTDVEALRTLDRLYSAVEDWNSLYNTLERLYALLGGDEQLTVHYRMGRLLERELGDAIRAVETYQAILDLHPNNRDAVDALEGMVRAGDDGSLDAFRVLAPTLSDRGEWPRLYAVYDAVTEREDDVGHKVTNLLTMGEIAERHMLEPLRAFECYGRAFSADPLAHEALDKLETLADTHGLWDGVPDLLNGAAGTIEGTPDALRLRLHAGRVQRDRLRDLEAASKSFEAVVADFPDNRDALSALDALYVEMDKPADLARVLKAEIDATGDADEKVAFLLRLGTVSESRLDSTRAALDARREVLYLKPAQWEAVRELRRMFDAGRHKAEILELLEPIYRDQSEWVDLATIYESVITAIEDPGERKHVLLKLGETWLERLGDKPAAIGWFGMALALDPGDEALLVQIELLADQAGAWAQYQDVLLAAASSAGEEGERRLYLWHKAADCARDRIGDLGQAEKINKWILDVDAADRQSLSALDAMYEGQGRWHDLLSVLQRQCEASSFDDERIGFYMRAAAVQRDRTQDLDGAVESFQAVVKMDDRHRGALEALADLHDVREEHQPLFEVLTTLADIAESGLQRAGLLRRMARLAESRLGKADAALDLWDEVSRIEPSDLEALRELERLHAAKEDWNAFIDTCEREIPLVRADVPRVVDLLRQVARAAEEFLADGYQAQQAWRRILDVAPEDVPAMQALRRLYRETGDLEGLSGILDRLAATGALRVPDLQALYEEHARLLTDELPRLDAAIQKWNLVLEMAPEHAEGLETLDRLYEDTGRIAECVATCKRRAVLASAADRKAEMLVRAADLEADRLRDLNAAAATLEEVLGFAPANLEVSERLQTLYTRLESWDALANVLLRRDPVLTEPDARVQNFADLARVYEERKGDRESAFLILVKAAEVSPGDEMVLADLWRHAQALSMWGDYVDLLTEVVDRMPEPLMQEHLLRFGEVLWKRADRAADAIPWFERVAARWEENETALVALTDLYAACGRPEELVTTLEKRVELTQDFLEKVQLQLRAGRVLDQEIRDGNRALAAYRRVLDFDEACLDALYALAALHEARKEWEDLLKVLAQLASLVPADEVATRMRMGEILEKQVRDPARAIAAYKEVVSIDPRQAAALDRLQALYAESNDFPGLAEVFERSLDMCSNDADRIALCERLGMLWEEALGDKRKALEYYQRWLDMDPSDDMPFETCGRLLSEIGDWNELVNLLEAKVSRATDDRTKVATLNRVAEVYEKRLEDVNAAASVHQRVLDVDASRVGSYSELARLFGEMESWEEVVQTIMRWKEHVEHDHEMVDLLLRAATIVKDRLENPDRALKLLGDVRRLDPANEAAAEKMRLTYAELEEWEKVAEVYLDQESHAAGDERRAAVRAAAADVFMNKLKDRPRAIQHYERALQLNPQLKDVALSLARAYVATEKWEKAEPLLDMLLAYPDVASDPARAAEIHFQIGLCAERLLDHDRAFREYQTAVKARPDHGPTILGLARLYQRRQLWQLAKDHFVKAIDTGDEELTEADVAAAQFSLGEVSLELNELDDAISYLDQVAEGSANRPKAVQILIQIAERKGDWASVVAYKQALLASKRDPFEKFAVMIEVGDIYRTKMRNFYGATQAYKEALELKRGERAVLMRLFELYLESGAIEDALYQLEQLAQAEESPEKRALQYVRMAALYQEKLGDDTRAIEHLNLALDADPDRLEAFRAIDEILTSRKDWEAQAENYRRMLERLRGRNAPELEYRLYANLGEIYRSRMKQMDYAIAAYSAAAKLKPEERRTHEILAQLYEMTGDQLDRAVEEHRAIINANPLSAEAALSYKAMRRLFLEMKDFDKAFVTSGVLVALGQADASEVEFFEGNLEPGLPWFKGTIDSLRWESHLMSKTENATLGRILQTLYQGLGSELGAKDLKDIGLKKKDELDLEQKLLFVNVYKAVAKALGPLPHKVYRDPSPAGLKIDFLAPPAFIVGADMLTGHEEREAAFLIGRQLTYLHPMHFVAAVKNMSELMVFIAAVLKFCKPDTAISTGAELINDYVRQIERRMPQQQKNHLAKLIEDLAARYPGMDFQAMFEDFFRSIERTALRAGTLVSGNVDVVLSHLKSEEVSFSGMPQRDRLEEVVRFAVSDDHFVLRRALGIAIEGTGA